MQVCQHAMMLMILTFGPDLNRICNVNGLAVRELYPKPNTILESLEAAAFCWIR